MKRKRCPCGTTIAELPVALWLILVCIAFPLIILVTLTVRFGLFFAACRDASQCAAKCPTYLNPPAASVNGTAAVTAATQVATQGAAAFSGITLTSTNVYIVVTNLVSQSVSLVGPNVPLSSPADTDNNMYQIKVTLVGQIAPLINGPLSFGNIPGLTGPYTVTVSSQANAEHPEGLND